MAFMPVIDLSGINSAKPVNRNLISTLALILGIQLLGFSYYLWFLSQHGYLPSPFYYVKGAVLLDFFGPIFWSDTNGIYAAGSFYPPLSFLFLKLVKLVFVGGATYSDSFALRESGTFAILFFLISYLIAPIFVIRTKLWNGFNSTEKTLLYFVIIISTPMFFELERGNIIIYTLFFLAPVLCSKGLSRVVCITVLINLKPYFALLLFYYLIRRNWKEFWLCTFLSGTLFLITGILVDQDFLLFFSNIFNWTQYATTLSLKEIMAMPSSISAYSYVLDSEKIQQTKYGYFLNLHAIANSISVIKWFVLAWVFVALYNNHNRLTDVQILAVLLVVITNLGTWVGGWTLIFYITLLPVFLSMRFRNIYLAILLLLFAPLDVIPLAKETLGEQYSYLTNAIVEVHWTLGMGSVLKPILNFILLATLLYEITQLPQDAENNSIA
jgi:hypothetical protein